MVCCRVFVCIYRFLGHDRGGVFVVRHGATFSDQADTDPFNFDNIPKRLGHDQIDAHNLVWRQDGFGKIVITNALRLRLDARKLRICLERRRIGIHPVDGFAVGPHVSDDRILAVLQSLLVGNYKPNRLFLENRILARGDLTDFFAVELIEAKWRRRPADST